MELGNGRFYPQSTRAHTPTTRVISICLSIASLGGLSAAPEQGANHSLSLLWPRRHRLRHRTVLPCLVFLPLASSLFSLLSTPKLLFPQTGSPKLTLLFGIKTKYIPQAWYLPAGASEAALTAKNVRHTGLSLLMSP